MGGPCEGCEAVYEFGDASLSNTDTLPGFAVNEPQLKLTGVVFQADGKTPAADVIVYIYHTSRQGIYETKGDETGWGERHGHYRGWVKTGSDGKYTFFTFRPGPYPNGAEPQHIHVMVKEPDKNEYYLDSFFFADDPMLTREVRSGMPGRGGSGIVQPESRGDYFLVSRDIYLGKNIPNYP